MSEYFLAPAAEIDLESIWGYTAENWGLEQADKYVDFLVSAFESLASAPKLASPCDSIRLGYRRWHVKLIG